MVFEGNLGDELGQFDDFNRGDGVCDEIYMHNFVGD